MLLYSDVKTEVQGRCVDADGLLTDAWFQRGISSAYSFMVQHSGGYWLREEGTITTASGTSAYALASNVWIPLQMIDTTNRHIVTPVDYEDEGYDDADRSSGGLPASYFRTATRGVSAQPSSASTLSFTSSSASDITQTCRVRGVVSSQEVTTTVTLTGTTAAVTTGYSFTTVYEINKSAATVGTVTATSNAGVVTVLALAPEALFAEFPWIRFSPAIAGTYSMRYPYIRKPTRVTQSTDRFEVPEELEECLVARFEEMGLRYYQETAKADALKLKNVAEIRQRTKDFGRKRGSFTINQGDVGAGSYFMDGLVGFKEWL